MLRSHNPLPSPLLLYDTTDFNLASTLGPSDSTVCLILPSHRLPFRHCPYFVTLLLHLLPLPFLTLCTPLTLFTQFPPDATSLFLIHVSSPPLPSSPPSLPITLALPLL